MENLKERIIITGDVNGNINYMYEKVNKVLRKCGHFDLLICTGDFFGQSCSVWDAYVSGYKKCPIETYILGPSKKENMKYFKNGFGCELAPNIHYLGNFGVFTTTKGVRIAYISGLEYGSTSEATYCTFQKNDIIKLRELCRKGFDAFSYSGIDLLVSTQWPQDITELDKNAVYKPKNSSTMLSWLVSEIMPRYHVCSYEGYAYERPSFVFKNKFNERIISTRFIALGPVSGDSKDRNLYAISLQPMKYISKSELIQAVVDETEVPFKINDDIISDREEVRQYFFDQNKNKNSKHNSTLSSKKCKLSRSDCWFCLSNPETEKHLIIAVGNFSYVALAKGGLVNDHLLICSIDHNVCMRNTSHVTRTEINNFKNALKNFFKSKNKAVVFFERHFKVYHLQVQAVPIPQECASNIRMSFENLAREHQIIFQKFKKNSKAYLIMSCKQLYFHVELPDGEELLHVIGQDFPLQFGRYVLVDKSILNMAEKVDWRSCQKSKDEESDIANKLRTEFSPYDFTWKLPFYATPFN